MSSWLNVTPEILLVLAVLVLPGLALAFSLRFKPWDALGLSVPLGLGVLAIANEASIHAKVSWGLPVIVGTTAGLVALGWVAAEIGRRVGRRFARFEPSTGVVDGVSWGPLQHRIAAGMTLAAAVVGAIAVAKGMGTPETFNQTYDGAFHVNSINAVAQHHLASPAVIAGLTNPEHPSGFYPPTFAAIGGLLVIYTGVTPFVAANVAALGIVLVWPLTMSMAIRRLARTGVFGYSMGMVAAATVGLFPALLMRFGTLWPNALSFLALGPALVLLVRIIDVDRTGEGADDPHGRLGWWSSVIAGLIILPGIAFAHPGAAFLLFYFATSALVWLGWRQVNKRTEGRLAWQVVGAIGVLLVVVMVFRRAVEYLRHIPMVEVVTKQYWTPHGTWDQAVGQVLMLSSPLSKPNLALAVLLLVGVVVALRAGRGRGRFLVWNLVVAAYLAAVSEAVQTQGSMHWTGFWYNDPYRLFSIVPVLALPLIAWGADAVRAKVAASAVGSTTIALGRRQVARPVVVAAVLGAVVVLVQSGFAIAGISNTVAKSYDVAAGSLISPGEAKLFERLKTEVPAGQVIAGNPFTGAILAGSLSGREVLFPTFTQPKGADRILVALNFRVFALDPAVCDAVKRLHIGVVVSGTPFGQERPSQHAWFVGFDNLDEAPGLTKIDSGDDAVAYRVGACRGTHS